MGNILQDMMGMLTRKKIATPKTDDFITIARYASAQEKLKPNPKVEAELVTMGAIKTFVSAGGSDSQQLSINGSNLSISNGNTVDLGDQEVKIVPYFLLAEPDGNTDFDIRYNMVDIDWDGGSGTHVLNLPSAVANPYRVIRVSNNATVTASNQIHVTPPVGETIDGAAFYSINKAFNGIAVWSDGVRWIVIQAKA